MKKSLYINGEWIETATYSPLYAPYSKEQIAEIPIASDEIIHEAIAHVQQANVKMEALTSLERAEILFQIAQLFKEHREQAAEIISLESAKPLKFALAEIDRTIETYQFAGEEAKRLVGEIIPMDAAKTGKNRFGYTIEQPLGTIAAITPFNFPQNLVAHKIGPAIATGNTVILKPASQTPLSAFFLAQLIDQTALPKGAFQVITGGGKQIGDLLVKHEKIKMITFTGSPAVGIGIRDKAGMKHVALELGSNAGLIIDEQVDLDYVATKCVTGAFSNQGQVCISLQRIYVKDTIYEQFTELFIEKTKALVLGDPLSAQTDVSAMIHANEQQRASAWVAEAVDHGAQLLLGGKEIDGVFPPTILANVDRHSKISCEEVFAPIVIINKITSIADGIESINDSKFGLQAGIFTKDIQTAFTAAKKLDVGGVMINDIPTYRVDQMPYGGVKLSGTGKEGLKYAIKEMTETKLIVWNNEGGI
ncbi:aldehyde dehydrogenase family protein [Priestia flexa]|uniref:Aldehyde dehydrogenase n=1 Tax=Priestia veravalensis TaxID=1414648 RepID=A0A0V8JHD4_9BACI|nr:MULTISPECIES: aldehyde dehydrogenase family protein [Priestia]KSU86080.1 aldehyde dehydrogenase [Priestia veravalensis]MCG7315526.1 aldehyde dehydrogenase family protein [Priestia flexa]SCC58171.1 Acyl-CoA reductase [Priestia flexa]